jgi:hypothetical protein
MHWGEKCGSIVDRLKNRMDSLSRVALDDSGSRVAAVNQSGPTDNTTITLVVTNQKLPWWALNRLAAQVHTSMARAIQPFATASDGDVLFAVTTDEVDNARLSPGDIGIIASELAWDAVLSSVPAGDPPIATTHIASDVATLEANVGVYELGPGSQLSITLAGDHLVARSASAGRYLPPDVDVALVQIGKDDFLIDAPQRDMIRFERKGNRAERLTINPGNWAIHAERVGPR